jgi:hypothetical protein
VCHTKCFTDYTNIPPRHFFIYKPVLLRWEMCTDRGEQHFEQLLWLLLVTFCWWLVGNKVSQEFGHKLSTVPLSAPCTMEWKRRLTTHVTNSVASQHTDSLVSVLSTVVFSFSLQLVHTSSLIHVVYLGVSCQCGKSVSFRILNVVIAHSVFYWFRISQVSFINLSLYILWSVSKISSW